MTSDSIPDKCAQIGAQVIRTESKGLNILADSLAGERAADFEACVSLLAQAKGRIIVSGMGKSGHIARKIAATFSSTGSPALYVHPAEASHGDLGMITADDVVLALSKSGETGELSDLLNYIARFSIRLIAITSRETSSLARAADAAFVLPDMDEACGETHAPTTSTTAMVALGDAFAVSLMRLKGMTSTRFHDYHPGGSLGAALRRVDSLMHLKASTPDFPLCGQDTNVLDAITILGCGGFGCVGFVDAQGKLTGIMTDGDVRRLFGHELQSAPAHSVMTRAPKTTTPETLAGDALAVMSAGKITSLFVLDNGEPLGLLHIHDCLAAGIV